MADRTCDILFLCSGKSARSVSEEAILNKAGTGRFPAFSAGSRPAGAVHPYALDLLHQLDHPVSGLRSKAWDGFSAPGAPQLDFAFTASDDDAAEACPVWPGQPASAHWGVPDPVKVEETEAEKRLAFAEPCRMLNNHITAFINLTIASLDRLSLKNRLDAIGKL